MAGGRGSRNRSRPGARAASAVVSFPRSASGDRLELSRLAPSGRSLLTGALIVLAALGLYAAARTTSMFAVDRIAVAGVGDEVSVQVRDALAGARGESLVGLDVAELERRAESVPMVAAAVLDRSFPHTLRVTVEPEVPVAVLRQGASSWLAAASGRVVSELPRRGRPALPRVWLARDVDVRLGERLGGVQLAAIATVAPLVSQPLPFRVTSVSASRAAVTLELRGGLELRLGDASDLALKLEVARRVLPRLTAEDDYLDVSVPKRPVAGATLDSQVELETGASTSARASD